MPKKFNELICKNCTSFGHTYRDCPFPVMSFGIICYYQDENGNYYYLMIQRKNTLAFMEFIKGRYNILDENYIMKLLNHMTTEEKNVLKNKDFEQIWTNVWLEASNKNIKEYFESKNNFNQLQQNDKLIHMINNSKNLNIKPEWGFPKGRRKVKETDLECSLREFCEETQFTEKDIQIEYNHELLVETFYGSNETLYRHSYFLAKLVKNDTSLIINPNFLQQVREIRDLKWCDSDTVIKNIGKNNEERLELFKHIHSFNLSKNNK